MAKYIYERWDYGIDVVVVNFPTATETYNGYSSTYAIAKNGEISDDRKAFSGVAVGEIVAVSLYNYNQYKDGNAAIIGIKRSMSGSTVNASTKELTKADIQAAIRKTTKIDTIIAEEGSYPDNSFSGDYWYVKLKKAFPTIKYKDSQGAVHNIDSAYYKDSQGIAHELGGITYKDAQGEIHHF